MCVAVKPGGIKKNLQQDRLKVAAQREIRRVEKPAMRPCPTCHTDGVTCHRFAAPKRRYFLVIAPRGGFAIPNHNDARAIVMKRQREEGFSRRKSFARRFEFCAHAGNDRADVRRYSEGSGGAFRHVEPAGTSGFERIGVFDTRFEVFRERNKVLAPSPLGHLDRKA